MKYGQDASQFFIQQEQVQNAGYILYQMATAKSIMGNHKESIPMYRKALENFQKTGNLYWPRRIHRSLFIAYSILGDQKTAMKENALYVKLKDSIFGVEKRQLIANAETKFNTERIRAEKEKAELTSKRNLNYTIGAFIILGLVILSGIFGYSRIQTKRKANLVTLELRETQKRLALEKQYRDSELKALKAQLNPHFIFNALNSIQEYMILNEKNLAGDYLGKFADLMRRYLQYSDAGHITLQQEVESLHMYLDLEKLRFGDDLQYTIHVHKNIHPEFIKIPTMLIQPYVENALKHGLLHKENEKQLSISFTQENARTISCIILDNGIGRKASAIIKAQVKKLQPSFSAKANESRLNLLNERGDVPVGVQTVDLTNAQGEAAGTKVILEIPILKN